MAGNDSLIYNSLNHTILEYRDSAMIAGVVRNLEDSGTGFLAPVDLLSSDKIIRALISDIKCSFSGDIVSCRDENKPLIIRPKPIIKNYPPPKDFPSFSADDYLRNLCFFVNQDKHQLCSEYRYAAQQFSCLSYNPLEYSELPLEKIFNSCSFLSGSSGLVLDFSGSDLSRYSQADSLISGIRKLMLKVNFHLPLPCHDPSILSRLLKLGNSRISLYITFPGGFSALQEIRQQPGYIKKQKKIDLNFIIRSLKEYKEVSEQLKEPGDEKVFLLPYYDGNNRDFFRDNVYLSGEDILNLKPNQQQIFSRSLINEHLYGRMFIKTNGDAFANLNHEALGNLDENSISELVKKELNSGKSWNLTRMQVKPCMDCLYRIFCPPISNYELVTGEYNFCDVL